MGYLLLAILTIMALFGVRDWHDQIEAEKKKEQQWKDKMLEELTEFNRKHP